MEQIKKILFIGNTSQTVVNFRLSLFRQLISHGYSVSVVCADSFRKKEITQEGIDFFEMPFSNRSTNFLKFNDLTNSFREIIRKVKPNLVFTYQLKGNIFGSKASKLENVPYMCLNEGLGDGFGNNKSLKGLITKIVSVRLHKKYLKDAKKVFLINSDDANFFVKHHICDASQIVQLHGVGIDCNRFSLKPIPKDFSVLNISRLVKTKGIIDYCRIAHLTRTIDPNIKFYLVGPEQSLKAKDIEKYTKTGDLVYLGEQNDVRQSIDKASIMALTSYREGFGISLVEGAASGRPCVSYNVTGPRDFVVDGKTGFLTKFKDIKEFANKIIYFKNNPQILVKMGIEARQRALSNCDSLITNQIIESNIKNVLK